MANDGLFQDDPAEAFAVQGLRAIGYADPFWEWQWVTRDKNMTPKR